MAKIVGSMELATLASSPGTPASGYLKIYAKTDDKLYAKNDGGVEIQIGSDVSVTGGGLAITDPGNAISLVLNASGALVKNLGTGSDELGIGAAAVTNAMLAGSIADTKLSTISTANKVSGSAIQLSATGAIEDSTGLKVKVDGSSIEISGSNTLQVKATGITNAMLAGSIAFSNMATLTASRALVVNSSGVIEVSATVSSTELGYLDGATSNLQAQLDAIGSGYARRAKAISYIVDNTLAPPTEVTGDRYVLSFNGGTPHANWDGALAGDIVTFGATAWTKETPVEGWVLYVDADNKDYLAVDDGTPAWEARNIITTSLTDGKVWIGNSSGVATERTLSGDVTVSNAGVTAIGATRVTNAMLAGSIADSNLSTISTANKVSGSAVQLASGGGIADATGLKIDLASNLAITGQWQFAALRVNEAVTVTATSTELNLLDGVTATTAELNILDGVTSTYAELNILDGATLTVTELNYVDGVTSAIQGQIDAKPDRHEHTQSSSNVTWSVAHNLAQKYVTVIVVNSDDEVIIPDSITYTDTNNLVITLGVAGTGKAVCIG